jgi:hypothetical protein
LLVVVVRRKSHSNQITSWTDLKDNFHFHTIFVNIILVTSSYSGMTSENESFPTVDNSSRKELSADHRQEVCNTDVQLA